MENIVGKGENAGYQHFLLFPRCFQKVSYTGIVKRSYLCGKGLGRYLVYRTDVCISQNFSTKRKHFIRFQSMSKANIALKQRSIKQVRFFCQCIFFLFYFLFPASV